ncbi:glycosyltransferase [Halosegnis sp.]|uniref:glycosyltransferase n=1 Tax=Halosegnis sp. TaxID=2864959 RepID=UPI0035D4992A
MARVAVFHNTLDFRGGADAVCVHVCRALATRHDVTLFTVSRTAPETVAAQFDVDLRTVPAAAPRSATAGDSPTVRLAQPPGAAALAAGFAALTPYVGPQLAARSVLLRAFVARRATAFDAAVSTANEVALPLPSVQYVHFPQFHARRLAAGESGRLDPLWTRLGAPTTADLASTRLLANSAWTADVVERRYDRRPTVCHPPVDPVDGRPWADREPGVLVLGRVAPDKRVREAITVVDRLRERGYELTCHIVGTAPAAYRRYVGQVRAAAADRPYVTLETDVARDRVETLLGQYRYGLNMKPHEHFGMAVAEYVAAGMVAFAPADGGQADVLAGDDRLLFDGIDGAVDRIAAAVDGGLTPTLPRDRFGRDRFADAVQAHVAAVLPD